LFGDSSEKRGAHGDAGAADSGGPDAAPEKDKPPRTARPRRPHKTLPVVEVIHDLDEADKQCPRCGRALEEMLGQYEESEEIDVIQRIYRKLLHKRKKYRCRCNACIETAPGPPKLRRGARYSVEISIDVAANKYLYHLPLERQVRMMREDGLEIDSQTLWDQIAALAQLNKDLPARLLAYILAQPCIGADETHWRYLGSCGQDQINKRWYIWSVCCDDAVVHRLYDSRSSAAAREVLAGFSGVGMADGYAVYSKLQGKPGTNFTLANCWAHARRKVVDVEKFYPMPANALLNLIAELFRIEVRGDSSLSKQEQLQQRAHLREQYSRPVVDAISVWNQHILATELPESGIAKAAAYMKNIWLGLIHFLSDPKVPLTNNHTERSLRGPVVGRKNHYGSKSKRGMEVAAFFYTIFESAKLAGAEPRAYLRHITHAALTDATVLLPHEFVAKGTSLPS
jgi:transposase